MGKNLSNSELVMRTGKIAFYKVPEEMAFLRMEGFTDMSVSKNAKEYSRQYVDEETERTDTTGYATSISYSLDRYQGNKVIEDIVMIHEDEKIGQDAVRQIIQVDMTTAEHLSGTAWKAKGKLREYTIVPDSDGGSTDCMTYSGNFKARGAVEDVIITTADNFQTVLVPDTENAPLLASLNITATSGNIALSPAFSSNTKNYSITATGTIFVLASAQSDSCNVSVLHKGETYRANGKSVTCSDVASGDKIYIIVDNGGTGSDATSTYTISVK